MAVLWELKLVSFWFVLVCYPFQLFSPRHLYLLIPYNTQAPRVFLALIQAQRDLVELRLRIARQVGASRSRAFSVSSIRRASISSIVSVNCMSPDSAIALWRLACIPKAAGKFPQIADSIVLWIIRRVTGGQRLCLF